MLKIKSILPVLALVLIFGLSNAAFAQLSCNVASTPVSRATDTGLTEPAGDLIFNCTGGGTATTTATMTIDYGVPITDNTAYPAAGNTVSGNTGVVRITNATSSYGGAAPTIAAVTNATGQVVMSIPSQTAPLAGTYSFTLTGILLSLSGSGKTSVSANVSVSPGNNVLITAGQTSAVVVTSVLPGIRNPAITLGAAPGLLLSTGTVVGTGTTVPITGGFSISVTENYIDSYRSGTQFNGGQATQGVQLLFTFSGIPTGITFSGAAGSTTTSCTSAITTGGVSAPLTGAGTGVVTATNNTLLVEITGTPSLTSLDTVTVACVGATVGSTATLPLTPGTVTATVTLAPTGTAFSSTGAVLTGTTTGQIPRYTANQLPSPALTVVNIIPATTNMLFPFVTIGNGFDTGFAIANTTGDPYGGTANGGARPQNGTVALYFFPQGTGTPFCVTTGGTATNPVTGGTTATNCAVLTPATGAGLSAGGVVNAGSTWTPLGSDILKSTAGAPASFTGYVFGVSNFTNAHPTAFVVDALFSGKFTSGGPNLVLSHPFIIPRVGPALGESLGH